MSKRPRSPSGTVWGKPSSRTIPAGLHVNREAVEHIDLSNQAFALPHNVLSNLAVLTVEFIRSEADGRDSVSAPAFQSLCKAVEAAWFASIPMPVEDAEARQ